MTLQNEGIGYKDLDELFSHPVDLEFIIELLSVELPNDYQKDAWQLNDEEKIQMVRDSKELGNKKFSAKDYKAAQDHYAHAIGLLEQLMLK
jgi:AH receptor-interacting protein